VAGAFAFRDRWTLPAAPPQVFDVLAAPDDYPLWWPNILTAQRVDADSGVLVCRSLLPYSLRMTVRREITDRVAGVLRVGLDGDLVGWSQWLIKPSPRSDPSRTQAEFRQEVSAPGVPGSGWPILRSVLGWNHRVMMWQGERGLRAHLVGRAAHSR
jgi:hypothetical protein